MRKSSEMIGPGATLGVFGGGQLGRMFALAAARLGYRVMVFAPERDCPTAQVAAEHVCAPFGDDDAVANFARRCSAITIEFENVPVRCLEIAIRYAPVRPGAGVLAVAQDRLAERAFIDKCGLPTSPHAAVDGVESLTEAVARLGRPGVIKTARFGYDGRGQVKVDDQTDLASAWRELNASRAIYERWVSFDCEVSVLVARTARGEIQTFGPIENSHANHILDVSVVPARIGESTRREAVEIAGAIAEASGLEGLICVEMFVGGEGGLLINELAPRPHNSGHLSIEACAVSQFEQQVRAVCNLPLGQMVATRPAAMANLLGEHLPEGAWSVAGAMSMSDVAIHLYGKSEARRGRKMGHVTAVGQTADVAEQLARQARAMLIAPAEGRSRTSGAGG